MVVNNLIIKLSTFITQCSLRMSGNSMICTWLNLALDDVELKAKLLPLFNCPIEDHPERALFRTLLKAYST